MTYFPVKIDGKVLGICYGMWVLDSDNDSDGGDDEEGDGVLGEDALDARIEKRRKRREFEKKRQDILFQYERCNYYSRSSAAIAFDLAWKLSKDNFDLLW